MPVTPPERVFERSRFRQLSVPTLIDLLGRILRVKRESQYDQAVVVDQVPCTPDASILSKRVARQYRVRRIGPQRTRVIFDWVSLDPELRLTSSARGETCETVSLMAFQDVFRREPQSGEYGAKIY